MLHSSTDFAITLKNQSYEFEKFRLNGGKVNINAPLVKYIDYSLEISDNGKYIPISKISYDNIGKLCIECITHPNVKNSTLTAMTVSNGYGKLSWKQLLSNVKSDIRFYPDKKDVITNHYIAVNIFLVILITTLLNIIKLLFNI